MQAAILLTSLALNLRPKAEPSATLEVQGFKEESLLIQWKMP
jgi:hypothetical protein